MWTRRHFLKTSAAALTVGCADAPDPIVERARGEEAFRRGADWLWRQRGKDGSWRSDRHDDLRTGHLLTALCLFHSTDIPRDDFTYPRQDALKSAEWLVDHTSPKKHLGFATDRPERPTWSNALAIHALVRLHPPRMADHASPMGGWLRRQQVTEGRDEGGFCQGFWRRPPPDADLRVDVRTTRLAVEALDALQVHAKDPASRAARAYLERCRDASGAFAPSLGAEPTPEATADAVLALVQMGLTGDDLTPHVEALRAMHPHDTLTYLAPAAAVFERVGGPEGWSDGLIRDLASRQAEDGSWPSGSDLAREPLVVTSYALSALGCALRAWPVRKVRRR